MKLYCNPELKIIQFEFCDVVRTSGVQETTYGENFGFDALNNKYCDMVESGIIDPTKVTRSVLQNAASVAATLLTTESIVTDIPTPPTPMAPAGGDMGGMY